MTIELTDNELRAVVASLEVYRRVKGAEGKLASQRQLRTDRDGAARTQRQYDALMAVVVALQARLTV